MLPARDVAPRAISQFLKRQPASSGKVRFAWESAVGQTVARATAVSLDDSGTLHVTANTDEWRREVVRSVPLIIRRMASLLGSNTVKRITVKRR